MGISPFALQLLIQHRADGVLPTDGRVLQLGKQLVSNQALCNQFLRAAGLREFPNPQSTMGDVELFTSLGMKSVFSLDASNFEGCDYIHDMNLPIGHGLERNFDFIYDGGTLEHIFNLPQVLKNIYSLLEVGGIVIHASPSNNHVDHGFFQFSPTFFYDYYSANNWEILQCFFFEYQRDTNIPWKLYSYTPGHLDQVSIGGLNSSMWGTWFVAKKGPTAISDAVPQQGSYSRTKGWHAGR